MKRKLIIAVNAILTLFLIFAVYNLLPLLLPLPEEFFNCDYPVVTITVCLQTLFSLRYLRLTVLETFLSVLLVNLIVDTSTLITGDELIPLRFPFASIFPVLGFFIALLIFKKKWLFSTVLVSTYIIFSYFSYTKLVPEIIFSMQSKSMISYNKKFLSANFLTIDSVLFNIPSNNQKFILLDFYFVGCGACEEKRIFLDSLQKVMKDKLDIYCICNGQLSSFEKFKRNALRKPSALTFLYDQDSAIATNFKELRGYPFEFLLDGNGNAVSTLEGFNEFATPVYHRKYAAVLINKP